MGREAMSLAPFVLEPGTAKVMEFNFSSPLQVYYRVQSDQNIEVYFLDSVNKAKFEARETFRYMGGPTGRRLHEWRGAVGPGTYHLIVGNSGAGRATASVEVRSMPTLPSAGFPSGLTGNTGFSG